MKNFSVLLILIFVFSCKENPEFHMNIKTSKTNLTKEDNEYLRQYQPDKIAQEIEIQFIKKKENHNFYGIMSCSYDQNFILDNKDFQFQIDKCDSNYPTYLMFKNNKSNRFRLLVIKNPSSKSKYFKIGFKKIIVPNDFFLIDSYNQQFENKKYKILWSEPIVFE